MRQKRIFNPGQFFDRDFLWDKLQGIKGWLMNRRFSTANQPVVKKGSTGILVEEFGVRLHLQESIKLKG